VSADLTFLDGAPAPRLTTERCRIAL